MTVKAQIRKVPTEGSSLHVVDIAPEETASPEVLVFSHGAGGCHINWHHQVAEFAQDHRVIVWDQRGFGNSEDPTGSASPARAAEDLLAVLDACGVERAWLVAQSMAGWGGSLCVRDHPERFAGVILCDTSAGVVTDDIASRLTTFRTDSAALAANGDFYNSLAVDPSWLERDPGAASALHLWSRALPSTYTSAVADLIATPIPISHLDGLPVGLIVGAKDPIFPPQALRDAFGEVADLGIHEIADAGHSPYIEAPEAFNELLRSLLRR